jgi:hypothetical protein
LGILEEYEDFDDFTEAYHMVSWMEGKKDAPDNTIDDI